MISTKTDLVTVTGGFSNLPVLKQIGLLIGLALSVALGGYIIMWSIEPNYRPIYDHVTEEETASILDALQRSGINYRLDKRTGQVLVPADKIYDVKMKLAQEGVAVQSGTTNELFNKQETFGNSQFMESMRYLRALELELARTITNMKPVKSVRVHLAVPKQATFLQDNRKPTASVFVDLYSGSELSRHQIAAIVNLVASSVPDLTSDHVTLVDGQGRMLNDGSGTNEFNLADKRLDYQKSLENAYVQQINDLITPILGPGKVKAQVSVDLDFTHTEKTEEVYRPDEKAVRSEHTIEEMQNGKSGPAAGVPGALSNQPPQDTQLTLNKPNPTSTPATKEEEKISVGNARKQVTRNFELDRTINYIKNPTGQLQRISVAVLLDDKTKVNKAGKVERTPLTKQEIEEITKLIKDAVGFNEDRGDSVTVVNRSFAEPEPIEPVPEPNIFEASWFQSLMKQILAASLILFIVLGVLKPVLRLLAARSQEYRNSGIIEGQSNLINATNGNGDTDISMLNVEDLQSGPQQSYEEQIQTVKKIATQDPKRVAHVLKKWVDGENA